MWRTVGMISRARSSAWVKKRSSVDSALTRNGPKSSTWTRNASEITRTMTPCAKNKGWLQPLIPVPGVHPVTEIEMLHAMNDANAMIVDMREPEDRIKGTIPNSYHIPYTEVAARLDELGCAKQGGKWNCGAAKKVYAFCNGPVCPQSPTAITAMVREGFPADRIYYYRGGMLDWDALGFPQVKDEF